MLLNNRWSCIFLIVALLITIDLLLDVATAEIPPVVQGLHNPPLGCHMRLYTYRITQADENGRQTFKRNFLLRRAFPARTFLFRID